MLAEITTNYTIWLLYNHNKLNFQFSYNGVTIHGVWTKQNTDKTEHDKEKYYFLLQHLIIINFFLSKYNLSFMYINVYLLIYKVMLIINIIIPGKIEEWGFVLN